MKKSDYLNALANIQAGGIGLKVEMMADLTNSMKSAEVKKGEKIFRHSFSTIQNKVPYKNIKEVREAMEKGERDAPRLPFAASGIDSVVDGVIFYTPKNVEKGLLTGIRPINSLSSRFVDGEGKEVSKERAADLLRPSYFKKPPSKAEHKEAGTGSWRTPYLTTIVSVS